MQGAVIKHGRTLRTFVCLLCLEYWLIAPIDSDPYSNFTDEIPIGTQVTFMMGVAVDYDSDLTPKNITVSDSLLAETELGEGKLSIINSQAKGIVSWHLFRKTVREDRIEIITV